MVERPVVDHHEFTRLENLVEDRRLIFGPIQVRLAAVIPSRLMQKIPTKSKPS